jgi:hypothetical protein
MSTAKALHVLLVVACGILFAYCAALCIDAI